MRSWENPHTELQRRVRRHVKRRLRRHNGKICRNEFLECVDRGQIERAEKLMQRLCRSSGDGMLEWKPGIVSEASLILRLGGNKSVERSAVVDLWTRSQRLSERTAFPHIAPAGNKSQLRSWRDFSGPAVFGVDLLTRPRVDFAQDRPSNEERHDLILGDECFALVLHADFVECYLPDDGRLLARVVVGDGLAIPSVTARVQRTAALCELAVVGYLADGEVEGAVDAVLPILDEFARDVAWSLVT